MPMARRHIPADRPRKPGITVVIPAGGLGRRLGRATPKQFLPLAGRPILARTVSVFDRLPEVTEIVIVAPRAFIQRTRRLVHRGRFSKVKAVVEGGYRRQESVRRGLHACKKKTGIVLVHDAVRPLVDKDTIAAVARTAERFGAAVVGVRVRDTIKVEGSRRGFFSHTLDRGRLWAVQTPQGFRFGLLMRAHEIARKDKFVGTDEASLVERLGKRVKIVPGVERNIKITTRADLRLAGVLLKKRVHFGRG
jgi:2-C-methyl-D-erythritol 4-phosphate cytidylyltransferase